MKKITLLIIGASVLAAGCTSKEQDEKIKAFWFGQYFNLMMKTATKNPKAAQAAVSLPLPLMQSAARPTAKPLPPAPEPTAAPAQRPAAPKAPAAQILDVTMDDDALPGKAPYDDRVHMKQDWTALQVNNQTTLKDLQTTFGDDVKDRAFYIMLNTEQKLKQAAYTAPNYATYAGRQQQLLAEQDKSIEQLMLQNKGNIRRLK